MSTPWEILNKFQEKLRPKAQVVSKYAPKEQLGTVQQFLPTQNGNGLPMRIQKIKNLLDESSRLIAESKQPSNDYTAVSFCQNCSCAGCRNQSMLTGPEGSSLNNTISSVVQSYSKFLEVQKQQFLIMLQNTLGTDASLQGPKFQEQVTSHEDSSRHHNQVTSMACYSSDKAKYPEYNSEFDADTHPEPLETSGVVMENLAYPEEKMHSTKVSNTDWSLSDKDQKEKNKESSVLMSEQCQGHFKVPAPPIKNTKQAVQSRKNQNESYISSCPDESQDDSFVPVRKSLSNKYNQCSVVVQKIDSWCDSDKDDKVKKKTISSLPTHEKAKIIEDLSFIFHDKFPLKKAKNGREKNRNGKADTNTDAREELVDLSIAVKDRSVPKVKCETHKPTSNENRTQQTRSGRTVKNPKPYWMTSVSLSDEETVDSERVNKSGTNNQIDRKIPGASRKRKVVNDNNHKLAAKSSKCGTVGKKKQRVKSDDSTSDSKNVNPKSSKTKPVASKRTKSKIGFLEKKTKKMEEVEPLHQSYQNSLSISKLKNSHRAPQRGHTSRLPNVMRQPKSTTAPQTSKENVSSIEEPEYECYFH